MREVRFAFFVVIFSFAALYLFAKLFGPIPFAINSTTNTRSDLFTSTGTGEVSATPTTAHVSLGVTATAASADDAKNQLNKTINTVIGDLKKLGIDEKKIQTTNFSVNQNTSGPVIQALPIRPSTNPSGDYTANATLEVETKDVATANQAVDTASKDGANVINGVSFSLTDADQQALEDQARIKAIADAKSKAEKIAKAAGLKLGRLVNITEGSAPQPMFATAQSADLKAAPSDQTNLQPGENKVQVTVTLSYETL